MSHRNCVGAKCPYPVCVSRKMCDLVQPQSCLFWGKAKDCLVIGAQVFDSCPHTWSFLPVLLLVYQHLVSGMKENLSYIHMRVAQSFCHCFYPEASVLLPHLQSHLAQRGAVLQSAFCGAHVHICFISIRMEVS